MRNRSVSVTVLLILVLAFGCGQQAEAPETGAPGSPEAGASAPKGQDTASPETAEQALPTSRMATESAKALEAAKSASAEGAARSLPEDHWLRGTSDVPDMLPAVVAPEAERVLLRESGAAYLEQIGDCRVLHLKGTYHEMGVQHGTLMKEEILAAANVVHQAGLLGWKEKYETGIAEAWERTSPFIPEKYKEEMRGLAEATGMTFEQVCEFTIFPELFHCSGFALWGGATADGSLLHGRVLDYMRQLGLDQWALIIIQEPPEANAFVNVAYSGMIGSVTGMNTQQLAIGEMGGRGEGEWDGMPMTLLVRECLEQCGTLDEARKLFDESPRTCQYYYVLSDGKAGTGHGYAVGVAAEPDEIVFIEPNESHPQLPRPVKQAVLMSGEGRYDVLVDRVEKMYGKITPKVALDIMARGVSMKSNMHNALFKPQTLEMWVANSTVHHPACNLPYRHYNVRELLTKRPAK